jgi:signal transduction histidine kinase
VDGRIPQGRRDAFDAAVAVGVAVLVLTDALLDDRGAPVGAIDIGLILVAALALAARRRAPRAVLLVATGCAVVYLLRTEPSVIPVVPVLIAKYTAVATGHRRWAIGVVSPVVVGAVYTNLTGGTGGLTREVVAAAILPLGWFTAAFVLGEASRQRQAYLHEVEQRAVDAERTREETARRRATEERLRIARELHDSLTHSISVIKVQAGVAVHLARKQGAEVPPALLAIQDASRDATRELRATLDVLRDGDEAAAAPDRPPDTGVERLPELLRRSSAAGAPATWTVVGRRRPLPPEVDQAAYRIVQEALTNVARHAAGAAAAVRVEYSDTGLIIQVDDDGPAQPEPVVPGVGLIGMRERMAALGGSLRAARRPDGGFSVRAEIPERTAAAIE